MASKERSVVIGNMPEQGAEIDKLNPLFVLSANDLATFSAVNTVIKPMQFLSNHGVRGLKLSENFRNNLENTIAGYKSQLSGEDGATFALYLANELARTCDGSVLGKVISMIDKYEIPLDLSEKLRLAKEAGLEPENYRFAYELDKPESGERNTKATELEESLAGLKEFFELPGNDRLSYKIDHEIAVADWSRSALGLKSLIEHAISVLPDDQYNPESILGFVQKVAGRLSTVHDVYDVNRTVRLGGYLRTFVNDDSKMADLLHLMRAIDHNGELVTNPSQIEGFRSALGGMEFRLGDTGIFVDISDGQFGSGEYIGMRYNWRAISSNPDSLQIADEKLLTVDYDKAV